MSTLITVLLIVMALTFAFGFYMLFRNHRVYSYRTKMSEIIFSAGIWDYKWRVKAMNEVTYNQMVLNFWRPLDSFYPDKSFLDLNNVRGFAPWEQPKQQPEHVAEFIQ